MSKNVKIILGILSILPFVFIFIVMFQMMSFIPEFIATAELGREPNVEQFMTNFFALFIPIMIVSFLSLGLMIYFIVHCVQDKTSTSDNRILWVLLLIFLGQIALPIYWYVRIWSIKEPISELEEINQYNTRQ